MPVPKRGDIWFVDLNPTLGSEQQGGRPVLVISQEAFNRSGLSIVCPITQGGNQARFAGFAVTLMNTGTQTQGVVMSNQVRTLDMRARKGRFVETVPDYVIDDVVARLVTIIEE
jgi:mRNA-degrading endonuclease toxin of MazEF toxin-antitoxin module